MGAFFKKFFATILGCIAAVVTLIIIFIVMIVVSINSLQPEIEPLKSGSVLEINMDELITDSPSIEALIDINALLFGDQPNVSLLATLKTLEMAAIEPNIVALSLNMDGAESLSYAIAEEIRDAVITFRERSGKPVYAYAESYSQSEYYLASVADSIYIHPLGQIEWKGIAMNSLFFGDLLSGLGVDVEVFRPEECRYKSAVEPFTRNSMSMESADQNQRLVDEMWRGVVGQVAEARGISPETLESVAAEQIVVEAADCEDLRMVTRVAYRDIYDEALCDIGAKRDGGSLRVRTLGEYGVEPVSGLLVDDMSSVGLDKVAILYIDGTIVDGASDYSHSEQRLVGSQSISRELRELRSNDDVKAVVVRVNSPGGSAMAADVIWREMELLRRSKPVIVSMGSYAASGGYYVSAPADAILADRYTLTGSIGVYGLMAAYEDAMKDHLHINVDGVVSSPSADFGLSPRRITPLERASMMRSVESIYESFTDKVSQGRNLPIGVVKVLSGGQVWTGAEAKSCGLVDGIGGLSSAVQLAIERSGVSGSDYKIIEVNEGIDEFDTLFSLIGTRIAGGSLLSNVELILTHMKRVIDGSNGVIMHSPLYLD